MIINFSNTLDEQRVQEMIDESLGFTTGVVNLSTATDEEVKNVFTDSDRWLFSVNYSGLTYLEEYRNITSGGDVYIYFYTQGAEADSNNKIIFDNIYWVKINPSTGGRTFSTSTSQFVPDIIYSLDKMNEGQLSRLYSRINNSVVVTSPRFGAVWTYNRRHYVYSTGRGNVPPMGPHLYGTAIEYVNNVPILYYDEVTISHSGVVTHKEYTSSATLTPVTE